MKPAQGRTTSAAGPRGRAAPRTVDGPRHETRSPISVEPLDPAELATCLSVQLWKQAGINEICKPIRDARSVEEFGLPETFVNGDLYDADTATMVNTSIA